MFRPLLTIETRGRGTDEIAHNLQQTLKRSGAVHGLCHLFIHHTNASFVVCENADSTVRWDLENSAGNVALDGDPSYRHDSEGADDMPVLIRSILTRTLPTIPVDSGRCDLGTWQGILVWEHRTSPHRRHVTITVTGDAANA